MTLDEMTPTNLAKVSDDDLRLAWLRLNQWYSNAKDLTRRRIAGATSSSLPYSLKQVLRNLCDRISSGNMTSGLDADPCRILVQCISSLLSRPLPHLDLVAAVRIDRNAKLGDKIKKPSLIPRGVGEGLTQFK